VAPDIRDLRLKLAAQYVGLQQNISDITGKIFPENSGWQEYSFNEG
jgi:phage protein U